MMLFSLIIVVLALVGLGFALLLLMRYVLMPSLDNELFLLLWYSDDALQLIGVNYLGHTCFWGIFDWLYQFLSTVPKRRA